LPTANVGSRLSWPRPKYFLFAFIGLMVAYVLAHNERFLVNRGDPEWPHIQSFKWWLLPHGIAGACALILGPMQFSDRLRQRYARFHRVVGRIYVAGVFIAAPLGTYIQYFQERMGAPRSFSFAVAIVFLEVRVVAGITGWENLGESVTETIVWACVAFSLLFADIVLQWQDLRRARPVTLKSVTASHAPEAGLFVEKAPV